MISIYLNGMHLTVLVFSQKTHFGCSRPFCVSMPFAIEPIPAMMAAGGKNDDIPAAMPATIDIGAISFPGG